MNTRLIDFTDAKRLHNTYDGANGKKLSILHENRPYMLKFPSAPVRNPRVHYSMSCLSEYLGSHIFQNLGIPAQNTLLGTFCRPDGRETMVVAGEDFVPPGSRFSSFTAAKNSVLSSSESGRGTELADVLFAIDYQENIEPGAVRNRFWEMFVVDAFIANWDRHNGNWGFLYDPMTDAVELAPVFDCGSALYPGLPKNAAKPLNLFMGI